MIYIKMDVQMVIIKLCFYFWCLLAKKIMQKISEHTKEVLRFIYKYLGVKFNIRECDEYDNDNESDNEEEEIEDEEAGEESDEEDKEIDYNKKFNKNDEPIIYKQYVFSCVWIGLKNVARIEL